MKLKRFPLIAAALVLIASTASLRAEFLYVSYGKGLLSLSINRDTGALTNLPGTPTLFADGTGPITLDRTGRLLYVSTGGHCGYRKQLRTLYIHPWLPDSVQWTIDCLARFTV